LNFSEFIVRRLQRAMVDFGADDPFAGAAKKLKEHYGIDVAMGAFDLARTVRGGILPQNARPPSGACQRALG
jgi:hypothetical protein